jgi:hypothetical protein
MEKLLKFTYLLDPDKVKSELDKLWNKYQKILANPNWDDLNEARGILYSTGDLFCEIVAPGAIERRLHLLAKPLNLLEFLSLVDSISPQLPKLREDKMFTKLEKFYLVVKDFKNKNYGGNYYLDEEKFIKLYNKYAPDESAKIGYKGRFGKSGSK